MAKINGKKLVLLFDSAAIVCETESSINFDAVVTELRCKGSGKFSEFLEDTGASGSINASGFYDDASGIQSGFALAEKLVDGAIVPFNWGGTTPGEELITGNAKLANVNISAPNDAGVTFTLTANISGDPTFGIVPS
jgi:predicted secreted protein